MLDTLDAAAVTRWCALGLAALRRHQGEIDELNVYPVPDGDTGTNLVLTLTSAQQALALDLGTLPEHGATGHGQALRLLAQGALLGARGNSGVILAQILRGLADAVAEVPRVGGRSLAAALGTATRAAYAGVADPVEGTLLTVVAVAARAAEAADTDDLPTVVRSAAGAAHEALWATPGQLPALARAGVVDAGARGLCLLLDALVEVVTGAAPGRTDPPRSSAGGRANAPDPPRACGGGPAAPDPTRSPGVGSVDPDPAAGPGYEVQYLLEAGPEAVDRLRRVLAGLGDSLAVVGGDRTWNVHVHVDDVGAAIEAGVEAGRPYRISVTRFADPPADPATRPGATSGPGPGSGLTSGPGSGLTSGPGSGLTSGSGAGPGTASGPVPDPATGPGDRAAVVVATGRGLVDLLVGEGATVLPGPPTTEGLLTALRGTGATQVVLLPGGPETQEAAGWAARQAEGEGIRVSVVPTRSPVQALAALAVRDPGRRFEDDVIAMAEAAGACRYAEVCYASREALTVAGPCRPGDVLALVEGEVHLVGGDLVDTCTRVVDRMLGGGGELVTLLPGAQAPAGLVEAVRDHLGRHWPFVQVQSHPGGQPFYPLLVGVE